MSTQKSQLDEEIESWKGFPWALRKADLEGWNHMIKEVREQFGESIEASGKTFTTDPFFMALLLLEHKMIRQLRAELEALGVDASGSSGFNSSLGAQELADA